MSIKFLEICWWKSHPRLQI